MASKELPKILDWYGDVSARRVDLVSDYAGSELFLVHGESLLLKCFEDPSLDFQAGFQMLHAVYLVERLLSNMKARNCNFHVVFLDDSKDLCIPPGTDDGNRYKYLLARSVIYRHLESSLKPMSQLDLCIKRFGGLGDLEFREYFSSSGAYFIVLHDGAISERSHPSAASDLATSPNATGTDYEDDDIQRKSRLRSMISTVLQEGSNVALINGMTFHDTKIIVDILEGSRLAKHGTSPSITESPVPLPGNGLPETVSISITPTDIKEAVRVLSDLVPDSTSDKSTKQRSSSGQSSRCLLSCLALKNMVAQSCETGLAVTYIAHLAALERLPLRARRLQSASDVSARRTDLQSALFLKKLSLLLTNLLDNEDVYPSVREQTTCDIADLLDGRIFNALLTDGLGDILANRHFKQRFTDLQTTFCQVIGGELLPLKELSINGQSSGGKTGTIDQPSAVKTRHSILPFSNQAFDKHLLPIKISVAPEASHSLETGRIFQEISHWHNAKRPLDQKKAAPVPPWVKKRLERKHHRYMADMQRYAASLTNASGGVLDPETIILKDASKSASNHGQSGTRGNTTTTTGPTPVKGGKTPKKTKKEAQLDAINAIHLSKREEQAKKLNLVWKDLRAGFDKEPDVVERYKKMLTYHLRLSADKREIIGAEVQYHLICLLTECFIHTESERVASGLRALLWDSLRRLNSDKTLTKEIAAKLRPIVELLNLPEIDLEEPVTSRRLIADPKLTISPPKVDGKTQSKGQIFQLLHCGPYFDRNLDSAPDPRVAFEPDKWQRNVLDQIDARRSLFVVAPTSAGKTFISFHAMKNVLQESDDGILVYIAPTKALVLQVAAEVQARFSKSFRHASGKCVWAVHTRDYRVNNPNSCQILVTVPQILQILLLSPSNAKKWSPRIRYIIFDEIHSIGQAEDGVVWEQLLLLAPCPIIALSATVGNPETFSGWLADTQKSLGNELVTVQHHHRFNDLRKFIYNPPAQYEFSGLGRPNSFGLLGLDGLEGLEYLHPVASLVNRSRGMPPDLSLEARDCLMLYRAMVKHQTDTYRVDSSLSPEQSLPSKIIRKIDIVGWEQALKALLQKWMADAHSPFDRVVEELTLPTNMLGDEGRHAATPKQTGSPIDPNDLEQTTLPLLYRLHERNALPAILFNYDRAACERICHVLTSQLDRAEEEHKSTSETWKRQVKRYEQRKAASLAASSVKKENKKPKKKGKDDADNPKDDLDGGALDTDTGFFDGFDPEAPVEGFHFANQKVLSDSELSGHLETLSWMGLPSWLNAGLRRGIGVHHAGMNRKYRQIVEILFRKGYLRVVIATGTLALGINMPCVTVVFSGDSVYLTALNYRQAAGRAGRRGFDLLGNVVFQGISRNKACRLLSSRLPDLNGHFPVTTTLILRLFSLLHECDSSFSRRAIDALLSQPRLYLNGPSFKAQVLHHLRFSIEYLRRQSLLSSGGVPINFAGLTSHLYYTENSSFAFNALVKGGYFHSLCAKIRTEESAVLREMMVVLGHIFCRRPCREADAEYKEIVKNSTSIVFLPELPTPAADILRSHNAETREVFLSYVSTFVAQHLANQRDCTLPLTGVEMGGNLDSARLRSSLAPVEIRSAFVALSGHGDDSIKTISELCSTVRQGVFLEEAVIPYVQLHPEESSTPLNAYLYDFFMHGDTSTLEKANHIRKSDVWYYLNDFSMILATIVASLANFLKISESDISQEDLMGDGDAEDDRREERTGDAEKVSQEGEKDVPEPLGERELKLQNAASSHSRQPSPSKKAVVAESWDDDVSSGEEEEIDEKEQSKGREAREEIRTKEEIEAGFMNVYRAFVKLSQEFNEKYRKIFA